MRLPRATVLHLRVGASRIHAEAISGGDNIVWAADAAYQSTDDLFEAVAQLAAERQPRCRQLTVTLERPPVQRRVLTNVPPVRDREVAGLVASNAGRFFRRNGAPLATDARWIANGHGRVVLAVAVAEPIVDAIVRGAAEAGLRVQTIRPADVEAHFELLPAAERAGRARTTRRSLVRLAVATLAMWLLAVGLVGVRLTIEQRAVDAELAAAQAPVAALRDVRREMRTAESMVAAVSAAERERGTALRVLSHITAALPDSAVLTSFWWRSDGSGVIAGAARRSADVLRAVERQRVVTTPRLQGAAMREALAGRDWERFTIVFGRTNP